jgi:hypothetical protein
MGERAPIYRQEDKRAQKRRAHHLLECGKPTVKERVATSLISPKSDMCEAKGEGEGATSQEVGAPLLKSFS